MRTNMQATSLQACRNLPNAKIKTQADRIFDVIEAHSSRTPRQDFSLNEIKALYRAMYGDIELSTVSARVNGLVCAGRLERADVVRKCAVTGSGIRPVRIPAGQRSLF